MPSQLPERPNLEHLKHQAKSLLRRARDGEQDALASFARLPAFAAGGRQPRAEDLALHDAQSVIAREHGFESWKALRDEVEVRSLTAANAIEEFIRCASGGAPARAERLLALHPSIATASLHTALVLGDVTTVRRLVDADPSLATRRGGPLDWEPLLYACHTSLHRGAPGRLEGLVAIARDLCARGADPNGQYHWAWHPELPRTVLWAALCAIGSLDLARVLLDAGADPTDGVSVHIAGGSGNIAALELLHRYGVVLDGIPGGVPPLVYMMTWGTDPTGPRWLLEHGTDPNRAWGNDGEAPLHVAARRWDTAMVDLLLQHGADLHRRRADGRTAHTLAALHGNHAVAAHLRAAGARVELSALDQFVAACARGDRATAAAMLDAQPELREQLTSDHHLLLHRPAKSGDAEVLDTMLAFGFDPDARDKDQVTPLHRAAMGGHPDATRVLLARGADVNALDGMFAATPLIWAVEGRGHAQPGADHVAVARILIDAGSSLEWDPPPGAPDQERTQEALLDLKREAAALS